MDRMKYIEAPQRYQGNKISLFLAGGITGCPDWQKDMVMRLQDVSLVLLNPRQVNFPIHDPSAAKKQITWEHTHLQEATAIAFWFPCETLCPIVLYELGAWSMTQKRLFVGVHPECKRIQDVYIQTSLARPDVHIVTSIEELAQQITRWLDE